MKHTRNLIRKIHALVGVSKREFLYLLEKGLTVAINDKVLLAWDRMRKRAVCIVTHKGRADSLWFLGNRKKPSSLGITLADLDKAQRLAERVPKGIQRRA